MESFARLCGETDWLAERATATALARDEVTVSIKGLGMGAEESEESEDWSTSFVRGSKGIASKSATASILIPAEIDSAACNDMDFILPIANCRLSRTFSLSGNWLKRAKREEYWRSDGKRSMVNS